MSPSALVELPDGRRIEYLIRSSARAKSLRLKMSARHGLTVVAPKGLSRSRVLELVNGKRDWIAARMEQFDEVRHLLNGKQPARPEAFDLPALAETWRVEYRRTKAKTVGARVDRPGRLLVYGAVDDGERCKAALRRWLARRAKEALFPWLESMAKSSDLHFSRATIKNQRTRWGSCSPQGVISLNAKLLFLQSSLVRYVLVHELCHTMESSHNRRFWALLRQLEPQADLLHGQMRDAWKTVPAWAHHRQPGASVYEI